MDPIRNPYSPGAGTQPPELAGRQDVLENARTALERIKVGQFSKSLLLDGLRGVGKTVLLDRIRETAEASGIYAGAGARPSSFSGLDSAPIPGRISLRP